MKGKLGTDYEKTQNDLDLNRVLLPETREEMKKRNADKLNTIYKAVDKGVDEGFIPGMYWDESKHGKLLSKDDIANIKQWGNLYGGWNSGNLTDAQRKAMEDYKKFSGGTVPSESGENFGDVTGLSNIFSSGGKLWQESQGLTTNLGPGATGLGIIGSALAHTAKSLIKGQDEGTFSNLDYARKANIIDNLNKEYVKLPKEQQEEYKRTATMLTDPSKAWNKKVYGDLPTTPEDWQKLQQRINIMEQYYGGGQ